MARSGPEDRQCVFPETLTTDVIDKEVQLSLTKLAILAHASVVQFLSDNVRRYYPCLSLYTVYTKLEVSFFMCP